MFKLISLSKSGELCNNNATKDPTTNLVCR